MAINERLIHTAANAAGGETEGLILHLDANDVDSYDGDGTVWYDITNHEYTPAVDPAEHFNTVTYTGNGSTGQSITGIGFQPDIVWIKNRDDSEHHTLFDSLSGADYTNYVNLAIGQGVNEAFASFDTDGFTLDTDHNRQNANGDDYVAWCLKAGGAAVSNTDGSVTSQVSVNNDLGFSIVKYSGGNASGTTVGHGLDVSPELIITKNTSTSASWPVFTTGGITMSPSTFTLEGSSQYLALNSTTGFISYSFDKQLGGTANGGSSSDTMISYCFASKRGVSKVGSYTGTGAAGNKVYTGFQPAFVMMKKSSASGGSWLMVDNKRKESNSNLSELFADTTTAESGTGYDIDLNGNGFTLNTTTGNANTSGATYIYLAFAAEKPDGLVDDTNLALHFDAADLTSAYNTTWTDKANSVALTKSGTVDYDDELGDFIDFGGGYYGNDTATTTIKDYNADFTIEFWYNFNTLSGNNALLGIMQDASNRGLLMYFDGSTMDVYNYKNGTMSGSQFTSQSWSTLGISTGKWYHIVQRIDSSTDIKTYVNGELKATSTSNAGGAHWTAMDGIRIGDMETLSYGINGKMGQFRIYKGLLSSDEIMQNYRFTKNDYPNGFNGTLSGGLSSSDWNSSGYFDLNGSSDYIELPTSNNYFSGKTNNLKTLAFWVKADTVTARQRLFSISENGNSNEYFASQWVTDSNALYISIRKSTSSNQAVFTAPLTGSTDWKHIVFVGGDGVKPRMYVNGSSVTVTTSHSGSGSDDDWITYAGNVISSPKCYLGNLRHTSPEYSDGKLGSVKLYDKVLSANEVAAEFNNTKSNFGL